MSAKSVNGLDELRYRSGYTGWTRHGASALVLLASVSALTLVVQGRHAGGLQSQAISHEAPVVDTVKLNEVSDESTLYNEQGRDHVISTFLAKRYRVSQQAIQDFVQTAFSVGNRIGIDPLLIIAVMAVESRFNPIAESVAGAKGLMQVIPKFHADKLRDLGGEKALLEPRANIFVGAQILREYIQRMGDVALGLRIYGGGPIAGDNSYPDRVLDEKKRLQQIVSQHDQATRTRGARD